MRKRNRKLMSILLTLSLLTALLAPMAAYAGTTYDPVTTKTYSSDTSGYSELGTFSIDIDPIQDDSSALIEVVDADGDTLNMSVADTVYDTYTNNPDYNNGVLVFTPKNVRTDSNGDQYCKSFLADLTMNTEAEGNEYKGWVKIFADVSDASEGELTVKITKASGQLVSGTVVVGKVTGGDVSAEVLSVDCMNDTGTNVTIRLTESVTGSFEESKKSVKLTLPSGFSWSNGDSDVISGAITLDTSTGYTNGVKTSDRDLFLSVDAKSTSKVILDITADIDVDESKASYGEVKASISGDTDMATSSLVVAEYGEYGATVSVEDATTVVAGMLDQEIGTIVVEEDSPGSLNDGNKTITLTLPANAKWYDYPDVDDSNITVNTTPVAVGNDGRIIKYNVTTASDDKSGKIEFKNGKVHLSCGETGDLKVKVGGSAGATGEATVATIEPAITVTANVTEVKIGMQEQAAGDIEIVEGMAEAINDDNDLIVELPSGVEFQGTPDVEVVEGDLDIETGNIDVDEGTLTIPVSGSSTTASKIKISNIEYRIDRTVAEGEIQVKIGGGAVNEVNDASEIEDLYDCSDSDGYNPSENNQDGDFKIDDDGIFPSVEWAAKVANAKCVTPADQTAIYKTVFTIGSATYTVNGVEKTMDVEPYIKNDRTYLPIRYAAYAAGITDANIMWNEADQSVIMIKGDRVVKMVIGDTTMYINGVAFTMDVAPEIVDPGRTMLPIRYVAQALGCEVTWDEATQSVTIN
ncbi:MAG: hypothetical protein A4E53_00109 [Pelotomaculum sp. PtaB.Bin104]|nr:MAG: hypothetical protein A4E53_00109 [Pelotomaculum sp. PtaB.Bin104]